MLKAIDFSDDIKRWAKETEVTLETYLREYGQSLMEKAVQNTPVDEGFLRNSWHVTINPSGAIGTARTPDKSGQRAVAEASLVLSTMESGDVVYFINGARYARFVEYGTSRMAPRAFVRKTLSQTKQIAKLTAQRIKGFRR